MRKVDDGTISVTGGGMVTCLTDWIQMTAMSVIGGGMFGFGNGGWHHFANRHVGTVSSKKGWFRIGGRDILCL